MIAEPDKKGQMRQERQALERLDDEITSERMGIASPEGSPPLKPVRRRSALALILATGMVAVGAIMLLVLGGIASFGMGIVLCAALQLAGFPVWVSAMLRHGERRHAHEETTWLLRR